MLDSRFVETLREAIEFVFVNEVEFKDRFFPNYTLHDNIDCFYMSESRCFIKFVNYDYSKFTETTINTTDFVDWVNELSTK